MEANALEWNSSSLAHAAIAHLQLLDWLSITITAYILKTKRDIEVDKTRKSLPEDVKTKAIVVLISHVLSNICDSYVHFSFFFPLSLSTSV